MKVKAVINVDVGGPLIIDDLDIGDPGPTHVIVKQFATGVCHSQLHQIHNPALPRPLVLGHESTGVVVAKGREVTHVNDGDRVMLTWVQRDRFEHTPDPTPGVPPIRASRYAMATARQRASSPGRRRLLPISSTS